MGGLFQLFGGRGQRFQELGHHPLLTFHGCPQNCLALVGVSFSVLMWYSECIMQLAVPWKQNLPAILDPVGSNQSLSCLMTCHSLKRSALPSSLLFHFLGAVSGGCVKTGSWGHCPEYSGCPQSYAHLRSSSSHPLHSREAPFSRQWD